MRDFILSTLQRSYDVNWLIKSKEDTTPIESADLIKGLKKSIDDKVIKNILFTKPLSDE